MQKIEIYFDGYCPESLLKGKYAEMKLNENDFWESVETGLQIAVFPPYATILKWRGKGKFRSGSIIASGSVKGLIMAEPKSEEDREIFPDEENLITNNFDLDLYINEIFKSKEDFDAGKFDINDPKLEQQRVYLNSLSKSDFNPLVQSYHEFKDVGFDRNRDIDDAFGNLHKTLYNLKLIFDFNWMDWNKGRKNLNNSYFDFSTSSILELSMYLTAIFRSDRFCEGNIEANFQNGTLEKIFNSLEGLIHSKSQIQQ